MDAFIAKILLLQNLNKKMTFYKKFPFIFLLFPAAFINNSLFAQDILLPSITTYIDDTEIEQRTVLLAEEIQQRHTESLTALLQSEGIQILAYGAYGLQQTPSIHGFTDETVRVVIDGVCVNNAQYGTFDFSSININDIERLEIVKGGFTEGVCDEGSVGGVIYITTKKQQLGTHFNSDSQIRTFFNASLPLDTFSQNLGFSSQLGDNSFIKATAKGTWANNRFLFKNYKNLVYERQNSEVKDVNSNLQFLHYFGNGNYFSASNLFYIGDKNVPGVENTAFNGKQQDLSNKMILSFNLPAIKDFARLENSFAWICNNRNYEEYTIGHGNAGTNSGINAITNTDISHHHVNSFKLSSSAQIYGWKNISQSIGISLDYTDLKSTNDGNHNQFSITAKETSKIKLNDIFTLSIPLAIKSCNSNFAFIPKAGIIAEFSKVNIVLDAYRMIQFPNMDDLYWTGGGFHGNPKLGPESGWGVDFNINVHHFIVPFNICIFTNYYKNKIQWNLSSGQPENLSSAFYLGVDFSAKKTLFGFLTLNLNVEYLYNQLLDSSNKLTYKKRIMWTPDFTAAFSASFAFDFLNWNLEANYVGKRYTSNLNLYSMDPYVLLNTSLEFLKIQNCTPYLRVDNILNTDYEAAENYPMPGISLTIGTRLEI